MASVKERIAALESYVKGLQPGMTTFLLEDGTEFHTPMGAFEYLYMYGAVTPTGKRIAFYPHPVEGVDGLTLSLYQLIDEAVEMGRLELPELESDTVERYPIAH